MLRAASTGLTPLEVYDLTPRELELWFEGWAEKRRQEMELMAWMQSNLINIHVPKGKPGVTVEKLLPRWARRKPGEHAEPEDVVVPGVDDTAEEEDPKAAVRRAKDRVRERRDRDFWRSSVSVAFRQALGEDEPPDVDGGEP